MIDMKNTYSFIIWLCGVIGKFVCDVGEYILVKVVPVVFVLAIKLILFIVMVFFCSLFLIKLFDVSEKP